MKLGAWILALLSFTCHIVSCDKPDRQYFYLFQSSYVNNTADAVSIRAFDTVGDGDTTVESGKQVILPDSTLSFFSQGAGGPPQPFGDTDFMTLDGDSLVIESPTYGCRSYLRNYGGFADGGEGPFSWSAYDGFDPEFENVEPGNGPDRPEMTYRIDSTTFQEGTPCP